MDANTKSALKKIKAAKLSYKEAVSLANWFGQEIASRVEEVGGLSEEQFFEACEEIEAQLLGLKPARK